jgi:hypothetical protein
MFYRGLTLAPGCRAWFLVAVFAFWVGKVFIGSSKLSTVLSGFLGFVRFGFLKLIHGFHFGWAHNKAF